jgi:hypothetical protein
MGGGYTSEEFMLKFLLLLGYFNLLDNNSKDRITERNTITRVHKHLSWETLKGKKTQQNFLNIDSQYNAKIMNQTTENIQH